MLDSKLAAREEQLVVFCLANELYGVEIGRVQEIIRMQNITRVPGAAHYIEGVINLRGRVVPVIDLRKRLNMPAPELTKESRIVVANVGDSIVGMMVDKVSEVLWVNAEAIEPPTVAAAGGDASCMRGIAKVGDCLIILLELERVLASSPAGAGELLVAVGSAAA